MIDRPIVVSSVAMSLDGRIDDSSHERLILSNDQDMRAVHMLRAGLDAILVGAGTLRADDPRLLVNPEDLREERIRRGLSPDLMKVTLTRNGDLSPELKFFTTGSSEKIVYCPERIANDLQQTLGNLATVVSFPGGDVDPDFLLKDLYKRGIRRLLVEGGESVHTLFLQAGLVDELRVAVAPFFIGDAEAPRFVGIGEFPNDARHRMHLAAVEMLGDMAVLHFKPNSNTSELGG